jgi:tRNA (mo5U34)-methyltransferase
MTTSLSQQVEAITWYHRIELPGGVITPGVNDSRFALSKLRMPESLEGKSVLDIGAWDGFYSFEAAQRGARRVLATDSFVWQGEYTQAGFRLAREALGLGEAVDDRVIDIMDMSPETLGETFDVVLFLGILYHLADPIGALRRAASMCDEVLLIETETSLNFLPYPAARVWPTSGLRGDPTNWFSFNIRALVDLLRSMGFAQVQVTYRTPTVRRVARAAKSPGRFREGLRGSRVTLHARR